MSRANTEIVVTGRDRASGVFRQTGRRMSLEMERIKRSVFSLQGAFGALGVGLSAAAVTRYARTAVREFAELERTGMRIEKQLELTGVDWTSWEQINEFARQLGRETLASAEDVRQATSQILASGNVTQDNFERSLRVAADLAEVLSMNLPTAARYLGRATSDVSGSLARFRQQGIDLSESQQLMIERLAESGRETEAFDYLLGQLEARIGGAAEAAGHGLAGSFSTLSVETDKLRERIGQELAPQVKVVTDNISAWVAANEDLIAQNVAQWVGNVHGKINSLVDIYRSLPDDVVGAGGMGLIGLMLFGKKGAAGAAAAYMAYQQTLDWADNVWSSRRGVVGSESELARVQEEIIKSESELARLQESAWTGSAQQAVQARLESLRAQERAIMAIRGHAGVASQMRAGDLGRVAPAGTGGSPASTAPEITDWDLINDRAEMIHDMRMGHLAEEEQRRQEHQRWLQRQLAQEVREEERAAEQKARAIQSALDDALDFQTDARPEINKFFEEVKRGMWEMSDVGLRSLRNLEDGLVDMAMTGRLEIRNFVEHGIRDLMRLQIQQAVIKPLGGWMSGLSFFHGGGIAGKEGTPGAAPAAMFHNAPRYHSGLMPDEFPAILQRGEGVFTQGQMAALGSAAGGPKSVTVNIHDKSGHKMQVTESRASFDARGWVIDVVMDGYQRNVNGLRSMLGG